MTEKFFYLDESPIYKGKYLLKLDYDKFLFPTGILGSLNVFGARVMNLSYAQYLRYCRDKLGAELIGKNTKYVIPYFENTATVRQFIKLLNLRMKMIMSEHNDPYEYKQEADGTVTRKPLEKNESNIRDVREI